MGKVRSLIGGLGVGVLAMYFYDPKRGAGRRAAVRDKLQAVWNAKLKAKDVMFRDASNRLQGFAAEVRSRFQRMAPADRQLAEHIRAEIGHVISHPGSIDVEVSSGKARLSGPILADEVEKLMESV